MEHAAEQTPGKAIVVWDNLNIHDEGKTDRWTAFNKHHGGRFTFVYTPIHVRWVNPIELRFSIVERRVPWLLAHRDQPRTSQARPSGLHS